MARAFFSDQGMDAPPHPLGIGFHPEWDRIRDRHNERFCNAILNRAAEARRAGRVRFVDSVACHALVSFAVVAAVIVIAWVTALGAVPQ